jgi:hypothetical protein
MKKTTHRNCRVAEAKGELWIAPAAVHPEYKFSVDMINANLSMF